MKWIHVLSLLLMCLEISTADLGFTYEALPGFTGHQLTGTVTLKGKIPPPKRYNLVLFSDPYYCGRISDGKGWRLTPRPTVGTDAELAGAVVFLEDVKKGKPGTTSTSIIQTKNCVFSPSISATQVGQTFDFQNWDPIQHRLEVLRISQLGAEPFFWQKLQSHPENRKSDFLSANQTGLHRLGANVHYQFNSPGILAFRCRLHDYMEGWSVVLDHPYFSITDKDGAYSLQNIPSGSYNVIVWHPLGKQETRIEIGAKPPKNLNILMTLTTPTTYPEDGPGNNPFGIDLVGDSSIKPTVELQKWDHESQDPEGDAS